MCIPHLVESLIKRWNERVYKTLISGTSLWDHRKNPFLCLLIKLLACLTKWTFFGTVKSGFMIFHSQWGSALREGKGREGPRSRKVDQCGTVRLIESGQGTGSLWLQPFYVDNFCRCTQERAAPTAWRRSYFSDRKSKQYRDLFMEVEEGSFFGFLRAMAQEKRPVVVPHAASSHAPLSGSMSGFQVSPLDKHNSYLLYFL